MKDGFCVRTYFRDSPPARITTAGRAISTLTFTNEIDVGVVLICRPVLLKIVHKRWPVVGLLVLLEISQRERKAVVNARQREGCFREPFNQPLSN